eukprot:gene13920-biopygen6551
MWWGGTHDSVLLIDHLFFRGATPLANTTPHTPLGIGEGVAAAAAAAAAAAVAPPGWSRSGPSRYCRCVRNDECYGSETTWEDLTTWNELQGPCTKVWHDWER